MTWVTTQGTPGSHCRQPQLHSGNIKWLEFKYWWCSGILDCAGAKIHWMAGTIYGDCSDQALPLWMGSTPVRVVSNPPLFTWGWLTLPYLGISWWATILFQGSHMVPIAVRRESARTASAEGLWCCVSTWNRSQFINNGKASPCLMSMPKHWHFCCGTSTWHQWRKQLTASNFGSATYRWEIAPTGLHHKLTGECHSRKFVRACTERVRSYYG